MISVTPSIAGRSARCKRVKKAQKGVRRLLARNLTAQEKANEAFRKYHAELEKKVRLRTAELTHMNDALLHEIEERKKAEKESRLVAEGFKSVIDTVGEGITVSDPEGRFLIYNRQMEAITGYTNEEANASRDFLTLLYPDVDECVKAYAGVRDVLRTTGCREVETRIRAKDGTEKNLLVSSTLIRGEKGELFLSAYRDITGRKRTETEREELIRELRETFAKMNMLKGMLPICASCKRIRNDDGYWEQVEEYVKEHSEAEFSHGICPECAQKLYPKYYKRA